MSCNCTRSPRLTAFATRISQEKNMGMVKRLRLRSPTQPSGGVIPGTVYGVFGPALVQQLVGAANAQFLTKGVVVAPAVPAGTMEGRSLLAPRSSRVSSPVMISYGRPEETSMSGATVQLLKNALTKPSPGTCGED